MEKCSPGASCLFKVSVYAFVASYKALSKLFAGGAQNLLIGISQAAWNDEASPAECLMICVLLHSLFKHFCGKSAQQWETLPELIQVGMLKLKWHTKSHAEKKYN